MYWQLYDPIADAKITTDLSGAMSYIEGSKDAIEENIDQDQTFELTPVWLTDEEYNELPEHEG